jgi:chemotaxis protein MotA
MKLFQSDTTSHETARVMERHIRPARTDVSLIAGLLVAFGAAAAGILSTGVSAAYFLQPPAAFIVLGGTIGVTLLTTPASSLWRALRRLARLLSPAAIDRELLIEELVHYSRVSRREGSPGIEAAASRSRNEFLRNALMLLCDVDNRPQLQTALETELRVRERQGEADARALEVAGGYAPTIGILGTVVGLIQVMRLFSSMQSVGYGIGTAFVSTIYGLVLANFFLLPAAHRIRARVADAFETEELIVEGVLAMADRMHPTLIRSRLRSFLQEAPRERKVEGPSRELAADARYQA